MFFCEKYSKVHFYSHTQKILYVPQASESEHSFESKSKSQVTMLFELDFNYNWQTGGLATCWNS